MRPDDWYMHMDERIAKAKAAGWTAENLGTETMPVWVAGEGDYCGSGTSEAEAWSDILADAELWDEVTAALSAVTP